MTLTRSKRVSEPTYQSKITYLLDGNLLVALRIDSHEHHERSQEWFSMLGKSDRFATCAVTEGTLLRVHMTVALDRSAAAAWQALDEIRALQNHVFWEIGFSYSTMPRKNLIGAKQVTDAWLAEAARKKGAKLATLDAAFAVLHPDVSIFV